MPQAIGIDALTVDDRDRITACKIIKSYLGSTENDYNPKSDKDKESKSLNCYIGLADDLTLPVLILVNEKYASLFGFKKEDEHIERIRSVAASEKAVSKEREFYKVFRPVSVVTNKIQLDTSEIDQLKITKTNRRVVVDSDRERILIWELNYYRKEFPTFYHRLGLKDDRK